VLEELQDIVSVLRRTNDVEEADRAPTTAAGIPTLVEKFRAVGMRVDAQFADALTLTPAASAAAYRVVQEGLTNAHRHGTGSASVQLRSDGEQIHIEIENPVADSAPVVAGSGFGLIGMRERVTAAGGTLEIRTPPGLFRVHVVLPSAQAQQRPATRRPAPAPRPAALGGTS
jgi:signal transduction histidine kinase